MKAEPGFEDVIFDEPAILLKINERYRKGMSDEEMYRATKDAWTVRLERVKDKVKIACSVYGGVVQEVFAVDEWSYYPHTGRIRKIQFEGKIAPKEIRDKYRGKSVAGYWKRGNRRTDMVVGPKPD